MRKKIVRTCHDCGAILTGPFCVCNAPTGDDALDLRYDGVDSAVEYEQRKRKGASLFRKAFGK